MIKTVHARFKVHKHFQTYSKLKQPGAPIRYIEYLFITDSISAEPDNILLKNRCVSSPHQGFCKEGTTNQQQDRYSSSQHALIANMEVGPVWQPNVSSKLVPIDGERSGFQGGWQNTESMIAFSLSNKTSTIFFS